MKKTLIALVLSICGILSGCLSTPKDSNVPRHKTDYPKATVVGANSQGQNVTNYPKAAVIGPNDWFLGILNFVPGDPVSIHQNQMSWYPGSLLSSTVTPLQVTQAVNTVMGQNGVLTNNETQPVVFNSSVVASSFTGNGAGLTDLPQSANTIPWLTATPTYRPSCWCSFNDWDGTPPYDMGNYYYGYITNLAINWHSNGMYAAGYQTIWLDDGWQALARDQYGDLTWNAATFTNGGVPVLTAFLHNLGYKVIIYTAYGTNLTAGATHTCLGFPGTTPLTVNQDFQTFANWNVDGVMVDACIGSDDTSNAGGLVNDPTYAYTRQEFTNIANAISAVNPPHQFFMLPVIAVWPPPPETPLYFNMANGWGATPGGYVDTLLTPYQQLEPIVASFRFVATNSAAWDSANFFIFAEGASEGGWNYTAIPTKAMISMSAMACSPMRVSGNMGNGIGSFQGGVYPYYTNLNVTPLIQDPYAKCGTEVYSNNYVEIFMRPIGYTGSGTNLIAVYNSGSSPVNFPLTWDKIGIAPGSTLSFQDLWANTNITFINTNYTIPMLATNLMLFKEWASYGGVAPWTSNTVTPLQVTQAVNTVMGQNGVLTNNETQPVVFNSSVVASSFTGNGAGLTDLPQSANTIPWLTATPTYRPSCWCSFNDWDGTPPYDMGNYYYGYITNLAINWHSNGMYAAGYQTIWLDDGWQALARDQYGDLTWNAATFTNGGVPVLTAFLHNLGYKVIIYTAYGTNLTAGATHTCLGFPGTTPLTVNQDFQTFANWNVDGVMVDACIGSDDTSNAGGLVNDPTYAYTRQEFTNIANAISAVNPPHQFFMLPVIAVWPPPPETPLYFNMANGWGATPGGYVDTLLTPYQQLEPIVASFRFVATNSAAWDSANFFIFAEGASEGGWNYTAIPTKAMISMSAMACSPMRVSGNMGNGIGSFQGGVYPYYTNLNVTPLIQDPYAKCGTEVYSNNYVEIFMRPIGYTGSGTNLIAVYNSGSSPVNFPLTWDKIGIAPGSTLSFQDLWANTNITFINTNYTIPMLATNLMLFKEWASYGGVAPWTSTTGSQILSNSMSSWPAFPAAPGAYCPVNSNGFPYVLVSTNGSGGGSSTWTGTNKYGW